jgi:hypothetical protein
MATTNISLSAIFSFSADKYLESEGLDTDKRVNLIPVTKYNFMVHAFNGSTVLMVAAIAAAFFVSMYSSFVIGAAGLFIRNALDKEFLRVYVGAERDNPAVLPNIVAHLFGEPRRQDDSELLRQIGARPQQQWHANRLILADYVIWKNLAPVSNS